MTSDKSLNGSWFQLLPGFASYTVTSPIDGTLEESYEIVASGPWAIKQDPPKIYFYVGAARCGKSTASKHWQEGYTMPEITTPRVVWNQDNLRLAMGGKRFTRDLEPLIHTLKGYAIKSLILGGYTVLVDGTHTTEQSIKELLKLDINAQPILIDTPKKVCVRRAIETDQKDLIPVIARHRANIGRLKSEGLDKVMTRLRREVTQYDEYRWSKS